MVTGELESSINILEHLPVDVLSITSLELLARCYEQTGDYPKAVRILETIAAREGLTYQSTAEIARLHLSQGNFPEASQAWQAYLMIEPNRRRQPTTSSDCCFLLVILKRLPLWKMPPGWIQAGKPAASLRQAIIGARLGDDPAYTLLNTGRALAALVSGAWLPKLSTSPSCSARITLKPGLSSVKPASIFRLKSWAGKPTASPQTGFLSCRTAAQAGSQFACCQTLLALYLSRKADYQNSLEAIQQAMVLAPDNPALIPNLPDLQAASGDLDWRI